MAQRTHRPTATPWVAFIRAINGSPANRIRNAALLEMITAAGCHDVDADGHTGNVFLRCDDDPEVLASRIEQRLALGGLKNADVMLRTPGELARLVESRPFEHLDPAMHDAEATFLRQPPAHHDITFLTDLGGVVAHLDHTVLCLAWRRPEDGSRALLSGGPNRLVERAWQVSATSRAWRVVERVHGSCERWLQRGGAVSR